MIPSKGNQNETKKRGPPSRNSPVCKPKHKIASIANLGEPVPINKSNNLNRSVSSFQKLNMSTPNVNYHKESNDNPLVSVDTNYETPKKVTVIGKE